MNQPSDSKEARLDEVLAQYLRAEEQGAPLDQQSLLAQHPDLADDLRSFFANRSAMERLAAPLRDVDMPTIGLSAGTGGNGTRVRYFGDYELLDEIARGGMGVVYRARQASLNRIVALKMILRGEFATAEDVRRFRQEAESAANLDHPNIVPIFEIGEHEGQQYYSMKLIEGQSLLDALKKDASVRQPRAAAKLMATVAEAVHHAHQRGVLHRDLKPGNILIDKMGEPHVTDFGLAKRVEAAASDATQTGVIMGTPAYMPPEQARAAKQLSTAVDVYSLGAILFELLTGEPPFKADSAAGTLLKVLSDESPSPRSINLRIDRDLDTICNRCLEKDPQRRYTSAAALADDLKRWLSGEPILARRITVRERTLKWARRHPAKAALVSVASLSALALVIGIGVSAYFIQQEKRKTDLAHQNLTKEQAATAAALERLKHTGYGQSMALVRNEYESNNIERARHLLVSTPLELRGWEWHYLDRICHSEKYTYVAPPSFLRTIAFRPGTEELYAAGGDIGFGPFVGSQNVFSWNVTSRAERKPFRPGERKDTQYQGAVTGMQWSPRGDRVALALWCMDDARDVVMTAGETNEESSGRIEIWDVASGKLLHSLKQHHSFVNGVAWSADGKWVASASSDNTINVFHAETGERKFALKGHKGQVMAVAFSPTEPLLASGSQGPLSTFGSRTPNDIGELKLWNLETGQESEVSLAGHELGINSVAFAPDGSHLATAGRDRMIRLWNAKTGELTRTLFGHSDEVLTLAFSPTGAQLASGSLDRTIRIWNVVDGKPVSIWRGHTLGIRALAFDRQTGFLASCASDYAYAPEIKLWEVNQPVESIVCQGLANEVRGLKLSADGQRVATAVSTQGDQAHELRVYDATSGQSVVALQKDDGYPEDFAFASPQKLVATYGNDNLTIKTFDLTASPIAAMKQFEVHQYTKEEGLNYRGVDAALAHDGSMIATYNAEKQSVVVWDCASGKELWRAPHASEQIVDLMWSDDLSTLVAINDERVYEGEDLVWRTNSIRAWDAKSHQEIFAEQPEKLRERDHAVAPDGSLLGMTQADVPGIKVWALQGPRRSLPDIATSELPPQSFCFSPDGQRVATVHEVGHHLVMKLWNVADGKRIAEFTDFAAQPGHSFWAEIRFSPDGKRIFTCGDGTIKVWDANFGTLLLTFPEVQLPMVMSRDGNTIAAATRQGAVKVWRGK